MANILSHWPSKDNKVVPQQSATVNLKSLGIIVMGNKTEYRPKTSFRLLILITLSLKRNQNGIRTVEIKLSYSFKGLRNSDWVIITH